MGWKWNKSCPSRSLRRDGETPSRRRARLTYGLQAKLTHHTVFSTKYASKTFFQKLTIQHSKKTASLDRFNSAPILRTGSATLKCFSEIKELFELNWKRRSLFPFSNNSRSLKHWHRIRRMHQLSWNFLRGSKMSSESGNHRWNVSQNLRFWGAFPDCSERLSGFDFAWLHEKDGFSRQNPS